MYGCLTFSYDLRKTFYVQKGLWNVDMHMSSSSRAAELLRGAGEEAWSRIWLQLRLVSRNRANTSTELIRIPSREQLKQSW
jgi:hypothetical protein